MRALYNFQGNGREFSQHYLALFSKVFHSNTVYQMVMERERNEIGYKANSQYERLTASTVH